VTARQQMRTLPDDGIIDPIAVELEAERVMADSAGITAGLACPAQPAAAPATPGSYGPANTTATSATTVTTVGPPANVHGPAYGTRTGNATAEARDDG